MKNNKKRKQKKDIKFNLKNELPVLSKNELKIIVGGADLQNWWKYTQ